MSLVDRSEIKLLTAIEKLIKRPIERTTVEGWSPDMVKPEPAHVRDHDDERPARRNNAPRRNSAGGRPADRKSTPSELQSLMRISYAVFCLKKKKAQRNTNKVTKRQKNTT